MSRLISVPYTFVLMNWAAVVGFYRFIRGQQDAWSGYRVPDNSTPVLSTSELAHDPITNLSDAA